MGLQADLISWLREKEPRYVAKIEDMSLKMGLCLQKLEGNTVVDSQQGEPTGAGLCIVSSGAIEEGVMKLFRDRLITTGVEIHAKPKKYTYQAVPNHRILRVGSWESDEGRVTTDATYRQFNFGAQNRIYTIPTELENKMYGEPVYLLPTGETAREARTGILRKRYPNISIDDYEDLVEILTT